MITNAILEKELSDISIGKLIRHLDYLNNEEIMQVKRAYDFACLKHAGQYRKSGEPYIIHPLSVAYILSMFYKPDCDTLSASLLHDVVEDTETPLSVLESLFGHDVAVLVDGVTKFSSHEIKDRQSKDAANRRKIITNIEKDPRSNIIKVGDNLHNLLTLQYHKPEKRVENAKESLELYVPLAKRMGLTYIATLLSELALKYVIDNYSYIRTKLDEFIASHKEYACTLQSHIQDIVDCRNIEVDYKDIYSFSELLSRVDSSNKLKDMIRIKLVVDSREECYRTQSIISQMYPTFYEHFRDYIASPKSSIYQSIDGPITHDTTVQIRTFEMDQLASSGIAAFWELYGRSAKQKMVELLENNSDFYISVVRMDQNFKKNSDFISAASSILDYDGFDSILYGSVEKDINYSSMVRKVLQCNNSNPTISVHSVPASDYFDGSIKNNIVYSSMIQRILQNSCNSEGSVFQGIVDLGKEKTYSKKINV